MKTTLEQADHQFKNNNTELALQLYLEVIQTEPNNALAHQGLARCYLMGKKYNEAFDQAHKALELNPELSIPHRIFANIYLHRRQFDFYEQELNNILAKEPNSSDIYTALGNHFLNTNRIEQSLPIFQKAVDIDPDNWFTHYCLASAHLKLSQSRQVYSELAKAHSLRKSYVTAFAFVSAFMLLNRLWLFPLILIIFVLSLALPTPISTPLVFLIGGSQLGSGIAYILLKDFKRGLISLLLFIAYLAVWIYIQL